MERVYLIEEYRGSANITSDSDVIHYLDNDDWYTLQVWSRQFEAVDSLRREYPKGTWHDYALPEGVGSNAPTVGYMTHRYYEDWKLNVFRVVAFPVSAMNDGISQETLANLRSAHLVPIKAPKSTGKYISFVGWFGEADEEFWRDVKDRAINRLSEDDNDFHTALIRELRVVVFDQITSQKHVNLVEESRKDSLWVGVYSDPKNDPEWRLIVADCQAGGWFEVARVKASTFEGGAAVPPGCEIRILG